VITYVDASALVKRYVTEPWSEQTAELTATAAAVATSLVSRAEVAAALARAARGGLLAERDARRVQRTFAAEWPDFIRLPVTEAVVMRAQALAWDHSLRGYDAIQLASGLNWQESVGADILFATFDRPLWKAAREAGLTPWPATW
jgi:predicted nucleic acid-binding protein